MLLEQGHKGHEEVFGLLSRVWKRDSSPKFGKERALERLEVKKGGHHIPNL